MIFALQKLSFLFILIGLFSVVLSETTDVVFILDRSGSISQTDFYDAIDFLYNVIVWLTIGTASDELLISVVTYSSSVTEEFDLDDYTSKDDLLAAVDRIKTKSTGGGTYTHASLDYVYSTSFTTSHGSRIGARQAVVVLTDGQSTFPSQTQLEAAELHNAGIEVFSIGVGSSTSSTELKAIASYPDSYYVNTVDTFTNLCYLIPALVPKLDVDVLSSVQNECAYKNFTTTTAFPSNTTTTGFTQSTSSSNNVALIAGVVSAVVGVGIVVAIIAIAKVAAASSAVGAVTAVTVFGNSSLGPANAKCTTEFKPSAIPGGDIISSQAPVGTAI